MTQTVQIDEQLTTFSKVKEDLLSAREKMVAEISRIDLALGLEEQSAPTATGTNGHHPPIRRKSISKVAPKLSTKTGAKVSPAKPIVRGVAGDTTISIVSYLTKKNTASAEEIYDAVSKGGEPTRKQVSAALYYMKKTNRLSSEGPAGYVRYKLKAGRT